MIDIISGASLAERSWQGLEQQLGETPVKKAREGLSGIAIGYAQEPVHNTKDS